MRYSAKNFRPSSSTAAGALSRLFTSPVLWLCLLLLLGANEVFAGQSLMLKGGQPDVTLSDPTYPATKSWRVEFEIHNWTLPRAGNYGQRIFSLDGVGATAFLYPDGSIALQGRDPVAEQAPCFLYLNGRVNALVRFQKSISTKSISCEIWNYDATSYASNKRTITSYAPSISSGGGVGYGVTASLGFLRVSTTALPLGSKPPTTADAGDWTELKFDGTLADNSGNNHGGSGTGSFTSTPNQGPSALAKTSGAPSWSNWVSLRAGFPATLDGTNSFSTADQSSAVTYQWKQLRGPSNVIWSDASAATPTITGLVFGTYTFQLTVADAAGKTTSTTMDVGAVATDANGVVVNADPNADTIFGPMIAFGKNPWSFADARNLAMENMQKNTYATPPSWSSPAENATVSHTYFDPLSAPVLATLSAGVTSTDLSMSVSSSASIDTSTLPTEVLVGTPASWEIVRVCSVSGSTLQVCYDGRGFHYGHDGSYIRPATVWPAGTGIWQSKITGHGTHFLSTICSMGAGFQTATGQPVISAGSINVTAGSTQASALGTSWSAAQNSMAIAVSATHNGAPFTFLANVSSASGTTLTFSRPFPADADNGSYSYKIFSDQRNVTLHYRRADGSDGSIYFPTAGCENDTSLYLYMGWDNAYAGQTVANSQYSYMDGFGWVSDFSANFYDMGLAHYAFYYRSGYTPSLTAARTIEDYWIRNPQIAQGDAGGLPRRMSVIGTFAAAVLDGDRGNNWSGLRSMARIGAAVANASNCDDDPRETAYELSWLSLAAQFDPDLTQRANWKNSLASAYARDNSCKSADNSFPSAMYWNSGSYPAVTVTKNSPTLKSASGAALPSSMCSGTAAGTALVTSGSAVLTAVTGTFVPPAGNFNIIVGGTVSGARYDMLAQFDYTSPTNITLSGLWPGDTGTVYWMINNLSDGNVASIANGSADTNNFGKIFGCMVTDQQMTLHRPWLDESGTYGFAAYNLLGKGSQPFMIGIKALQMRYGTAAYAPYAALDTAASNWVTTTGFDPLTKGLYYGRGFPVCEGPVAESGVSDVIYRNPNCIENSRNVSGVQQARARNAEAQNAVSVMYLANPTAANKQLGDTFYGATYGASDYTQAGYFSDGITASNLDDVSLGSYKWPGFFFGIGMAHQWPAARLGGVAAPQIRKVSVPFSASSASGVQMVVTAPSGAQQKYHCSVSPCSVSVDDRQGSHWITTNYLSSSGQVLSSSAATLIPAVSSKR